MTEHDKPTTPFPSFVNAQEVADRAGVSRSAVSRAFTPGASIAHETRVKVMEAAEQLGYEVNDLARGLLARRSQLVGLIVTEPEQGFRAHLVSALTRSLIQRGRLPVVLNTGRRAEEIAAAQKMLVGYRAEATIVLSGSPPSSVVELARRNGQPLILIGRSEAGADHIRSRNRDAATQAAELFHKAGFTRLGLASSTSGTPSVVEREEAFVAAALGYGITVSIARGDNTDYAGGRMAATAMLAQAAPQAVFCINDLIAFGFIDRMRECGIAVPLDISVIGFDDIPEASWAAYDLTTFRQDPEMLAAQAMALLEHRLAHPHAPPKTIEITAPLVLRGSVRTG
jgi:DNA-binding LacI/PurR family transcriptional regulator